MEQDPRCTGTWTQSQGAQEQDRPLRAILVAALIGRSPHVGRFFIRASLILGCLVPDALFAAESGAPLWPATSDSAHWVGVLRTRVATDRLDIEARRQLAALLGRSGDIEERREAYQAIQEALRIDGDDADLWAIYARLQERRGFREDARDGYKTALDLNPNQPGLWGDLAQHELTRFQRYHRMEFLNRSMLANARTLGVDPVDSGALRRGLRIAYYQGDNARMDSLSLSWLAAAPDDPWPSLVRGMLYTGAGAWSLAEEAFRAGLTLMTSNEAYAFTRLDWFDEPAERQRSRTADSTGYFEDYWRWLDPTPADPINPRLLEHYRRLVQAELLFGLDNLGVGGWDHAPGRMLIRYGLPENFRYMRDVWEGKVSKVSSTHGSPTLVVRYGQGSALLSFTFVDYNLSGRYFDPVAGVPLAADYMVALNPTSYAVPFLAPNLDQEVEVWRFQDPQGEGRIEVVVALPESSWPLDVLDEPHRLSSKLSVYDPEWRLEDASIWSWTLFEIDALGRLVGVFTLGAAPDSAIVGLETSDRLNQGRAAGYASLAPQVLSEGPQLSDIAFLRTLQFDPAKGGRYRRGDGSGIPNPGHRYRSGEPIGIAFEAYGMTEDAEGTHRARIGVTVGQRTRTGFLKVVLGEGRGAEAELSFDTADLGSTLKQLLAVDVPPLKDGSYVLRITVDDLISGKRSEHEAPFTILKPGRTQ